MYSFFFVEDIANEQEVCCDEDSYDSSSVQDVADELVSI